MMYSQPQGLPDSVVFSAAPSNIVLLPQNISAFALMKRENGISQMSSKTEKLDKTAAYDICNSWSWGERVD